MYLMFPLIHKHIMYSWVRFLTFDGEVHALADVSAHVVADLAQVVAAVLLQHMFDE